MKIFIDKSSVSNYAEQFVECSNKLDFEIKRLNSIIDSINNAWEGADASMYVNAMKTKYELEINQLKAILDSYSQYLKKVPDAYTSLDESFSSKSINV